jgi:hypothetical protein
MGGMSRSEYSAEEVARFGRELYERDIRPEVEPEHTGCFLVVDVVSGDYEVADEDLDASERLLERRPDAMLYGQPIGMGSMASARIGGRFEAAGPPPPQG